MSGSDSTSGPSRNIVVYSRPGCHLCELLIEKLAPMVRDRLNLEIRDIETRADWTLEYGVRIPLVEYDGDVLCQHHLDENAIRVVLDGLATR